MKIEELYRSGVTDNEELGDHARSAVAANFNVSFAHERGLEELFGQMMSNQHFQQQLEVEFAAIFQRTVQKMVRSAQGIRLGHGWTDDFEVEVQLSPKDTNSI